MSATWDLPLTGGAGGDSVKASRQKLNDGLESLRTNFSNATEPSSTVAYMWWVDTTTGTLKMRNAADTAWITVLEDLTISGMGLMRRASPAADANLDMNGDGGGPYKIINLLDGTAATDAATKGQVDGGLHQMVFDVGTINASATIHGMFRGSGLDIVDAYLITATGTALHASNYWQMTLRNITDSVDLNLNRKTTESGASNAEAITANVWWAFNIDQNQTAITAADNVALEIVKVGTPSDLTNCKLVIIYTTNV